MCLLAPIHRVTLFESGNCTIPGYRLTCDRFKILWYAACPTIAFTPNSFSVLIRVGVFTPTTVKMMPASTSWGELLSRGMSSSCTVETAERLVLSLRKDQPGGLLRNRLRMTAIDGDVPCRLAGPASASSDELIKLGSPSSKEECNVKITYDKAFKQFEIRLSAQYVAVWSGKILQP